MMLELRAHPALCALQQQQREKQESEKYPGGVYQLSLSISLQGVALVQRIKILRTKHDFPFFFRAQKGIELSIGGAAAEISTLSLSAQLLVLGNG
jgi:hypothetical protein